MRKLIAASLLGLVLMVFSAAPALAQLRDPFDPVVSTTEATGGTGTTTTETGTQVGTTDTGDGSTVLGNQDSLANTGAETEPWLVAAYAAIAIGAGALAVSKLRSQPV